MIHRITLTVETDCDFELVDVALLQSENILSHLTENSKAVNSAYITKVEKDDPTYILRPVQFILEVKKEHVGMSIGVKGHPTCFEPLGIVQEGDIGKRIYKVNGVYQVENNEQRDKRINK